MTAAKGMHGRRFLVVGVGFAALMLVSAGCVDEQRFAKEAGTKDTRQLVVPTRITPPVTVARIEGAPASWNFNERLARALRQRDIPAGTQGRGKASYVLRGQARTIPAKDGQTPRLHFAWSLFDAAGKRVGKVVQLAGDLGSDWKKPDSRALDRIADRAATRLRPLVPNAPVNGGQSAAGRAANVARAPVTAIGRQDARRGARGLSGRLLALRGVTSFRAQTPQERIAMKRAAAAATNVNARPGKAPPISKVVNNAPKTSAGGTISRRTVVTERIALVATAPARMNSAGTLGHRPPKTAAIRPDANRTKFRLSATNKIPGAKKPSIKTASITGARANSSKRPVQIAEASERGGAPFGLVQRTKGYWVQLSSATTARASHASWNALVSAHPKLLERQPHAVNRADLGRKGVYYRLQLGPYPNVAQARRICATLRAARVTCILVAPTGQVALGANRRRAKTGGQARKPAAKPQAAKPRAVQTPAAKAKLAPRQPASPQSRSVERERLTPRKSARRVTRRRGTTAPRGTGGNTTRKAARRAAAVKPAAGKPSLGEKKTGRTGAAARKPKSRADKLPFQRSRTIPGLTD